MSENKKDLKYSKQVSIDNTLRLRELLNTLPDFSKDYFRSIEPHTSSRTRLSYAYDIRLFFCFLRENNPLYKNFKDNTEFSIKDLENLKAVDFEEYMAYLKVYKGENSNLSVVTNDERGLSRKMSAIRSFYKYYYTHEMISDNPTTKVNMPKIHEKAIIRLDTDEIALLLDYIETCGDDLSPQERQYHEKTKLRDLAIVSLLLGTGIRVSECVGLDINDIDFKNNSITITRKGGNESQVFFGDEVEYSLKNYLNEFRNNITPLDGHSSALFLSTRRSRMGIQAVENMVKKYAKIVCPNKKITPHKLRSTYGTALYRETGDIYLVADVLGHKDVNTTKKHYAAINEDRRRSAANIVKLREK